MKILVINAGSSSLKFQLIDMEDELLPVPEQLPGLYRPVHPDC